MREGGVFCCGGCFFVLGERKNDYKNGITIVVVLLVVSINGFDGMRKKEVMGMGMRGEV